MLSAKVMRTCQQDVVASGYIRIFSSDNSIRIQHKAPFVLCRLLLSLKKLVNNACERHSIPRSSWDVMTKQVSVGRDVEATGQRYSRYRFSQTHPCPRALAACKYSRPCLTSLVSYTFRSSNSTGGVLASCVTWPTQ